MLYYRNYIRLFAFLILIMKSSNETLAFHSVQSDFSESFFMFISLSSILMLAYFSCELAIRFFILPLGKGIKISITDLFPNKTKELSAQGIESSVNISVEIVEYAEKTFLNLLNTQELKNLKEAIVRFSTDKLNEKPVLERRITNLKNHDLYHFGWNIGKRLKKSNPFIATFLKHNFPWHFSEVETSTIARKLSSEEGSYLLPKIPLNLPLTPFPFAEKLGIA